MAVVVVVVEVWSCSRYEGGGYNGNVGIALMVVDVVVSMMVMGL